MTINQSIDKFQCNNCQWKGVRTDLASDTVDTCFGDDEIEICPQCGSMDVVQIV